MAHRESHKLGERMDIDGWDGTTVQLPGAVPSYDHELKKKQKQRERENRHRVAPEAQGYQKTGMGSMGLDKDGRPRKRKSLNS